MFGNGNVLIYVYSIITLISCNKVQCCNTCYACISYMVVSVCKLAEVTHKITLTIKSNRLFIYIYLSNTVVADNVQRMTIKESSRCMNKCDK